MSHVTKPEKPRPDFPLFPHATKRWAKKIRGKLVYFGPWNDPEGALQRYLKVAEYLHAGLDPPDENGPSAVTVADLCNAFLAAKDRLCEAGELTRKSWRAYKAVCEILVAQFGRHRAVESLKPSDFGELRAALAKRLAAITLKVEIQKIRVVFAWGYEAEILDKPVRFGPELKVPSKRTLRLEKQANGTKLYEAAEIHRMLEAADPVLRAMILLAVNCGYGSSDVSGLTRDHLDLAGGWVTYPRGKTGTPRRSWLWPQTVAAIREALSLRPKAVEPEYDGHVFLTSGPRQNRGRGYGRPYVRATERSSIDNVGPRFKALTDKLELTNHGFYTLRRTHRTVSDETADRAAIDFIMGHADESTGATYRQRIGDNRLRAVAEHVRKWLFDEGENG